MYAPISLLSYSSGIYTDCSSTSFWTSYFSLNHAVVIVGYDVNGNYIIKNSWGSRWGQNGFGVISKDRDCGLSSFVFKYFSRSSGGRPMNYTPQLKLKSGYNN
jgi:C1A family cysteine protease